MNKNKELLPYYQKLSKMIEFREGVPYWIVKAANRTKIGSIAGSNVVKGQYRKKRYTHLKATINKIEKQISAHRLAWFIHYGELPGIDIDHKDGNGLNNNIDNLRIATKSENCRNVSKRVGASSKYMGIYWKVRDRRWIVEIKINKKRIYIGTFKNEISAAMTYDNACRYYGVAEFANLNFPIS